MGQEIERKFLLKEVPADLQCFTCLEIEQAYLCNGPVVRVRKENDDYYMTYKGSGLGSHTEYNLPLTRESYEHLAAKHDGRLIVKHRYLIPLSKEEINEECLALLAAWRETASEESAHWSDPEHPLLLELDVFEPPVGPLTLAEIEFPNEESAAAFKMPAWFAEDVTLDRRYHNSNMALGE